MKKFHHLLYGFKNRNIPQKKYGRQLKCKCKVGLFGTGTNTRAQFCHMCISSREIYRNSNKNRRYWDLIYHQNFDMFYVIVYCAFSEYSRTLFNKDLNGDNLSLLILCTVDSSKIRASLWISREKYNIWQLSPNCLPNG